MEKDIAEIKKDLAEVKDILLKLLVQQKKLDRIPNHQHELTYIPGGIGWVNLPPTNLEPQVPLQDME